MSERTPSTPIGRSASSNAAASASRTRSGITPVTWTSGLSGTRSIALPPIVEDRFDVVPVGVVDECAEVARVVLGPLAWTAVVAPTSAETRVVKCGHRLLAADAEREVEVLARRALDEGHRSALGHEHHALGTFPHRDADGLRHGLVERSGRIDVPHAHPDVVDQARRGV